jgi:hypothetical protein
MTGETRALLPVIERPPPADVPADELAFLRGLGGAAAIRARGRDGSRTRVVVTLLHGNEPSGFRAVHAWLRSEAEPATDTLFVLGAVEAVLAAGDFTRRAMPSGRDLNRCFAGADGSAEGALARAILDTVRAAVPEAVLDLHNNSGHSPAYGVVPLLGPVERGVISDFASSAVIYDLRIGSLIEMTSGFCPTIAIEAGRAGDPAADEVATAGLRRFLERERLEDTGLPLTVLGSPIRVQVVPGVSVGYADAPLTGVSLTVSADADRHNFALLPAGTTLGWVAEGTAWPVTARGADAVDRSPDLFRLRDGRLETTQALVPVMMTTDPQIATADCICYLVSPLSEEQPVAAA